MGEWGAPLQGRSLSTGIWRHRPGVSAGTTMKKKLLVGATILVTLLIGVGYVYRADLMLFGLTFVVPNHAFSDVPSPAPPDYANPAHWAALPERDDLADTLAVGATALQATAAVDVFFVHPTTFVSADAWNQSLDDTTTNETTDQMVMQGQASAFNACCRIYAPRYRQATLAAFFVDGDSAPQALDLAYSDVVAAFRYYLATFNRGRPFVRSSDRQLAGSRLLIGANLPAPKAKGVPICRARIQISI